MPWDDLPPQRILGTEKLSGACNNALPECLLADGERFPTLHEIIYPVLCEEKTVILSPLPEIFLMNIALSSGGAPYPPPALRRILEILHNRVFQEQLQRQALNLRPVQKIRLGNADPVKTALLLSFFQLFFVIGRSSVFLT